jgi:hypothetical protein
MRHPIEALASRPVGRHLHRPVCAKIRPSPILLAAGEHLLDFSLFSLRFEPQSDPYAAGLVQSPPARSSCTFQPWIEPKVEGAACFVIRFLEKKENPHQRYVSW